MVVCRTNGWSWPPHPLQFVALGFLLYFSVFYFGVANLVLPFRWQLAGYVVIGTSFAVHALSYLLSMTINPVDPYSGRKGKNKTGHFDRTQHTHVIENRYCYICETQVLPKSKHCGTCNKCVSDFDHHCKWLNNCVGGKNYKFFLLLLVSGLMSAILVLIVLLYILIAFWVNPQLLHPDYDDGSIVDFNTTTTAEPGQTNFREGLRVFGEVPGAVFCVANVVTFILLIIAVALMMHLYGFHIYLLCNDMGTYDYIVKRREEENRMELEEAEHREVKERGGCCQSNKVAPTNDSTESLDNETNQKEVSSSLVPVKEDASYNNQSFSRYEMEETALKTESAAPTPPPPPHPSAEKEKPSPSMKREHGCHDDDSSLPRKPKRKKRKKRQERHLPPIRTVPPLFSAEDMVSLDRSFNSATGNSIDLGHSQPQTFLEQHIVRRYSLTSSTLPPLNVEPYHIAGTLIQSSQPPRLSNIPVIDEAPPKDASGQYHSSSAESLQEMQVFGNDNGRPRNS